jgi:hypothetical protein
VKILKQSTEVVISFGPFLDKGDGVTLEDGLVSALDNATTGIMLSKNGGALAVRHATVTATTYDAHGCYLVTLDSTDTGTLGRLRVIYTDAATCLPVWEDFLVVPANVFDALCSTDKLQVDVQEWKGSEAPAMTGDAFARLGAPVGASIAADIATADAVADAIKAKTDNLPASPAAVGSAMTLAADAVDAAAMKADAIAEIVAGVLGGQVETAGPYTLKQVLSITLAVLAGVTANGGATLKTPDGSATRVSATINTSSERTAMTLTPSA